MYTDDVYRQTVLVFRFYNALQSGVAYKMLNYCGLSAQFDLKAISRIKSNDSTYVYIIKVMQLYSVTIIYKL